MNNYLVNRKARGVQNKVKLSILLLLVLDEILKSQIIKDKAIQ